MDTYDILGKNECGYYKGKPCLKTQNFFERFSNHFNKGDLTDYSVWISKSYLTRSLTKSS